MNFDGIQNDSSPTLRGVPSHFFMQTPVGVLHDLLSRCGLECSYTRLARPTEQSPDFVMQASISNMKATGKGRSKRAAKQSAIVHLLKALFRCPETTPKSPESPTSIVDNVTEEGFPSTAIDALQTFCDSQDWAMPSYSTSSNEDKGQTQFVVSCEVNSTAVTGLGTSETMATKHAAFKMLFYQLSYLNSSKEAAAAAAASCDEKDEGRASSMVDKDGKRLCNKKDGHQNDKIGKSEGKIDITEGNDALQCEIMSVGDSKVEKAKPEEADTNYEVGSDDCRVQSLSFLAISKSDLEEHRPLKRHYSDRLIDLDQTSLKRNLRNQISVDEIRNSQSPVKPKQLKPDHRRERLSPEAARRWLSALLIKNMNLAQLQTQNLPEDDDSCSSSDLNPIQPRNTGGADVDNDVKWTESTTEVVRYEEIDISFSKGDLEQDTEDTQDAEDTNQKAILPTESSGLGMTRSLPEFAADFIDQPLAVLPQTLSEASGGIPAKIFFQLATADSESSNLQDKDPKQVSSFFSNFRFIHFPRMESDSMIIEGYSWGATLHVLSRFLSIVVMLIEVLFGLLYLCTDRLSSSQMLYSLLITFFFMFLLRKS